MKRIYSIIVVSLILAGCGRQSEIKPAPKGLNQRVVLISIDAFRFDYFEKCATPNFDHLVHGGVKAQRLIPVFPSLTFPNHYSIATGLYAENHGIISNYMYDPVLEDTFSLHAANKVTDGKWWGGEPIWVTAEKQGLRTATFFWAGSEAEIGGVRPAIFKVYDNDVTNLARIDTVLSWLQYPVGKRPRFIAAYFSFIDHIGHKYGPDSQELITAVTEIDSLIGRLMRGLGRPGNEDVNLIIVSDHGMAPVSEKRVVFIDDLIDLNDIEYADWYVTSTVLPRPGKTEKIYRQLKNAHPHLQVWKKSELPQRFHFQKNRRIHPLVLLADTGWQVMTRADFERMKARNRFSKGTHGFDNAAPVMQGIFLATGPAFKNGLVIPPFQNIHIYAALNYILGTLPAKNDGSLDSLRQIFIERE